MIMVSSKERRGRTRPLDPDQAQMVAEHWQRALKIAFHFRRKYGRFQVDFEGAAALGICQAAATWRADGDASFATHMNRRVSGACLDAMRATGVRGYGRSRGYRGAPGIYSLNEKVNDDDRSVAHLELLPSSEGQIGWELESQDEVEGLTKGLPTGHRKAMRLLYLHAEAATHHKTGNAVGLSQSRIASISQQSLVMIRDKLDERRCD